MENFKSLYLWMMFPNIDIIVSSYFSQVIIITMLLAAAWKYEKLKHLATFLAIGVNLFVLLLEPIGKSELVQHLLINMIKG